MTDSNLQLLKYAGRYHALTRLLAILGAFAVLRGALAPWSVNSAGLEVPGFAEGMVLAVVAAVAVVAGPRHPLGAALAIVAGVRAGLSTSQEVLWSLGSGLWFAGYVWTAAGAMLLLVAGVVSAVFVFRNWSGERGEPAGEHGEPPGGGSDEPVGEGSDAS